MDHLKRKNFNVCAVFLLDSQVCFLFLWTLFRLSYISAVIHWECAKRFFSCTVRNWCFQVYKRLHGISFCNGSAWITSCQYSVQNGSRKKQKGHWGVSFLFFHLVLTSFTLLIFFLLFCLSYLNPEAKVLVSELNQRMPPQFAKLNKALAELVKCQSYTFSQLFFFCSLVAILSTSWSLSDRFHIYNFFSSFIYLLKPELFLKPINASWMFYFILASFISCMGFRSYFTHQSSHRA